MSENSDMLENDIVRLDESLMPLLLVDRTRTTDEVTHNIIWATDNYVSRGEGVIAGTVRQGGKEEGTDASGGVRGGFAVLYYE